LLGPPLALLCDTVLGAHGRRVLLLTRASLSRDNVEALRPIVAEDGRRAQRHCSVAAQQVSLWLQSSLRRRESLKTCVVQPCTVCAVIWTSRQNTPPSADGARPWKAEKQQKTAHRGSLSLDNRGPHTCSAGSSAGVMAGPASLVPTSGLSTGALTTAATTGRPAQHPSGSAGQHV
jgi:hypothetical protein